LLAFWLQVQ